MRGEVPRQAALPERPEHWVSPGDAAYDETRAVWNGLHDRRPAHIARCRTATEVSQALRYAAAAGLDVTVRGGGHHVAGSAVADGTLMVDVSPMRAVTVDVHARVAVAEGGCRLRDLDTVTAPYGLACPTGTVADTGLGGLALGGGYGWLARRWGLTCDHILAAQVVLADGSIIDATEHSHPELLWALRGGGGTFGVVTRFTLRLRPVGQVLYGAGVHALDDAPDALAAYRAYTGRQPVDLHTVARLGHAGDQPWVPEHLRGGPVLLLLAVWSGDPEDGPAQAASLFDEIPPAAQVARAMPYPHLQALGDDTRPKGHRYSTSAAYLDDLPGDAVRQLVEAARENPSPRCSIDLEYLRGAIADVPEQDSAFPGRAAPYQLTVSAHWTDPGQDAEHLAWSRATADRTRPFGTGGGYLNHAERGAGRSAREHYGPDRYARLAAVKKAYDPTNLLRGTVDIRPEGDHGQGLAGARAGAPGGNPGERAARPG
ncbi:FAD-binding oxidoreductase [Streptomyces rubellomurinus]|uniref:FAD-binding oxidoreductase n=1 Tax=Streptomyces rubellomurinus (strain ATCC 31215) TaxID=359131 RepID=UPI0007C70A15|nr:FAD-binding oxidoreductase [Streptomyces rubellomurinus]